MRLPSSTVLRAFLIASVFSASARASAPSSPFAPGGPLAPWAGPLPSAPPPSAPPPYSAPSPSPSPPPPGEVVRVPGSAAPVDADWRPLDADAKPHTTLSAIFNPALMRFGKTTGRFELAPYGPHALFLELSRLSLDIEDKGYKVQVTGREIDVGYHLFPLSQGARGFYLGPRYVRGSGETEGASGEFTGWGGDLGYQWVVANHLVINLGVGAMYVSGTAQLDPEVLGDIEVPEDQESGFESLGSGSGSYLLPLVTLGIGLAI